MITLLLILSGFAHADHASDCSTLLNIPSPYVAQFARYTQPEYIVPLPHVDYRVNGIYRELELHNQSVEDVDPDDPNMLSARANVKVDSSDTPRWMTFENVSLSDQLDPGFVYRTMLAHFLINMPEVREIDFDLYTLPDYGVTRGRLMRGMDLAPAMALSDAAEALREFGFTVVKPQAVFVNEPEPRELILRMRATRP